jgi:hypothetical protein
MSHVHVKKTTDGKLVENDHTDLDVFAKRNGLTETRTRYQPRFDMLLME